MRRDAYLAVYARESETPESDFCSQCVHIRTHTPAADSAGRILIALIRGVKLSGKKSAGNYNKFAVESHRKESAEECGQRRAPNEIQSLVFGAISRSWKISCETGRRRERRERKKS